MDTIRVIKLTPYEALYVESVLEDVQDILQADHDPMDPHLIDRVEGALEIIKAVNLEEEAI